jgi:hypothetical protein
MYARYASAAGVAERTTKGESEGRSPSDDDDPWWTYSSEMGPAANAALDALRAAVLQ